jgi:hypothetical protein
MRRRDEDGPILNTHSPPSNGEHNRWCQKVKDHLIYCRFTGQLIGKVGK